MAGAAVALALGVAAAPAWAQTAHRAWVSGHGTDSAGCGAPTAACRSLQYAHDHIVAAGGEIDILDPAGYGALTITKAISIVNDGVGTAGVQAASGNGITINVGPNDKVYLRGLSIDGVGTGLFGIELTSAGNLTVLGCVVRHFAGHGIELEPLAGFPVIAISGTVTADNLFSGIDYQPPSGNAATVLTVDQDFAVNNGIGIETLPPASGFVQLTVGRSVFNANDIGALIAGDVIASLDSSAFNVNSGNGVAVQTGATVLLSRSVVAQNGTAGVGISGTAYTTQDNRIFRNNGGDVLGGSLLNWGLQ